MRHFKRAAITLGLQAHPHLHSFTPNTLPRKTWQWHAALRDMTYRCDLESIFQSFVFQEKQHDKAKGAEQRELLRALPSVAGRPVSVQDVWNEALLQHFRAVAMPGMLFSVARGKIHPKSLTLHLKHCRASMEAVVRPEHDSDPDFEPDPCADIGSLSQSHQHAKLSLVSPESPSVAASVSALDFSTMCFFNLVHVAPSHLHTVRVAAGAGNSLQPDDVAVLFHEAHGSVVSTRPSGQIIDPSPVALLSGFNSIEADDESRAVEPLPLYLWQRMSELVWVIPGCEHCASVCTEMVASGSFPSCAEWYLFVAARDDAVTCLERAGHIEEQDVVGRWCFTSTGVASLQSLWKVHSPKLFFQPRVNVDEMTCTSFELLFKLREQGWTWDLWVHPKQHKRAFQMRGLPLVYCPGQPKVYYSTGKGLLRQYLLLLLHAEDGRIFVQREL
eukprot:6480569-Amphidinium_carterae.2